MIESWFPTTIYSNVLENFKGHNKAFYDRAIEISKLEQTKDANWHCSTYTSLFTVDLRNEPVFSELITALTAEVFNVFEEFGIKDAELFCDDAWINIAEHKDYQEFHNHANSHFSLVYYIATPENCGNIVFQNPYDNMFEHPIDFITAHNTKSCFYKAEESKVIIFRSNVKHMVEANKSDEKRISLAMNFTVKKTNTLKH